MCAGEEEVAFAGVAGEGSGALEFGAGFVEAVEFLEQVGADAGQEMVGLERGLVEEGVDEIESGLRTISHRDSDSAVEFDDGRWNELDKRIVEGNDAAPIGLFRTTGAGVTRSNGSLNSVGAEFPAKALCAREGGSATTD